MTDANRDRDPRIPEMGSVPTALRMFRVNWVAAELRSPSGVPLQAPDFVSRLGRAAVVVDVRTAEEITGPSGYIPGSVWVPQHDAVSTLARLDADTPVVLVSRGGERASDIARELEARGKRFVAALMGGIVGWRQIGLSTVRDPAVLDRRGEIRWDEPVWVPPKKLLAREDVVRHVGQPGELQWIKLASLLVAGRMSCVDGRDAAGVVGTPGGDAGEFIACLATLERLTGRTLRDEDLRVLLLRRLDAFGHFSLHTDVHASNAFILSMRQDQRLDAALSNVFEPLEWRRFLRSPPPDVRALVLEHLVVPQHTGCGHLRLSMVDPDGYGVRAGLVQSLYRVFLGLRWEGLEENEITVLPGGHSEGAVLRVLLDGGAETYSRIPLVSPMAAGSQVFVAHPQVSAFLRGQLVRFLLRQDDLDVCRAGSEADVSRAVEDLAGRQLERTLSNLAPGLPVFDVVFGSRGVEVRSAGAVPQATPPVTATAGGASH